MPNIFATELKSWNLDILVCNTLNVIHVYRVKTKHTMM